MARTFRRLPDIGEKQPEPHRGCVRKSSHSAAAAPLEPAEDHTSERRISVRPAPGQNDTVEDEELKRAVIAFARAQQPSSETRARILSSVFAALGLSNASRKVD